jgi:hypothetical protein
MEVRCVGGGFHRGNAERFQAKPTGGLVKDFDGV